MRRIEIAPRQDWQRRLEEAGLVYHSNGLPPQDQGRLWWDESAYWELSESEVDWIEAATNELHARCLEAVDFVVRREPSLMQDFFALPVWFSEAVSQSWLRGDPSLMGRMDLAVDPQREEIRLLEYNADTPTLCIETALIQWHWLQDVAPGMDQFNSVHERLLNRFTDLKPHMNGRGMHFAAYESASEEWLHSTYFRDVAEQAGIPTRGMDLSALGWDGEMFRDPEGGEVRFLHKLYPWEWARQDEFGPHLVGTTCGMLEPPWKALLSDKAILAVLHRLFPNHPNILPAFMDRGRGGSGAWVEKPCLGREGANITILQDGQTVESTAGEYDVPNARWVSQAKASLLSQGGWTAMVGSWVIGSEAAGIIIREAQQQIIQDSSKVVPHLFVP